MSSIYVRDTIKQFLDDNSSETFVDMTAAYEEINDLLSQYSIDPQDPWVGIDFIGNSETPITVQATNGQGTYRETGTIYLHVVQFAQLGVADLILPRAEALRDLLRGQRIGNILIEDMTPVSFAQGAALQFEGGYIAGSFLFSYEYDFNP